MSRGRGSTDDSDLENSGKGVQLQQQQPETKSISNFNDFILQNFWCSSNACTYIFQCRLFQRDRLNSIHIFLSWKQKFKAALKIDKTVPTLK